MAVKVEIRSEEKISVEAIAALKNLNYGVSDKNYILNWDVIDEYTFVYDAKCIGRGFEVHFEDTTVCLRMFYQQVSMRLHCFMI